ncbi:SWPV1-020 [Shearwaterpox virus]|uniref:SWPV1-020 n=1 Tax=Shearwaterpox virus TaxID=1974596 RepID=A0A1V0S7P1_CNPV|nr:SWPV1-020 [Shearwaterpox virus]
MEFKTFIKCVTIIILSHTAYKYYYNNDTKEHRHTYFKEFCYDNWVRHIDKCYFISLYKASWKDSFDRCNLVGSKMVNKSIIDEDRMPIRMYKDHWLHKENKIFLEDDDNCEFMDYSGKRAFISNTSCDSLMFYACVTNVIKL